MNGDLLIPVWLAFSPAIVFVLGCACMWAWTRHDYDKGYEDGREECAETLLAEPGRDDLMAVADAVQFYEEDEEDEDLGPDEVPPTEAERQAVTEALEMLRVKLLASGSPSPSGDWRDQTAAELAPAALALEAAAAQSLPGPVSSPKGQSGGYMPVSLDRAGELTERRATTGEQWHVIDYDRMPWAARQEIRVWDMFRQFHGQVEGLAAEVLAAPVPWETAQHG